MALKAIFLVGVHANERCAPVMAKMIREKLLPVVGSIDLVRVPAKFTLLANLDCPETADPAYIARPGSDTLDTDLESWAGDAEMLRRFPDSPVFEFHDGPDTGSKGSLAAIPPEMPTAALTIGRIMPQADAGGPFQIGYWQNQPPGGIRGKHYIELRATRSGITGSGRTSPPGVAALGRQGLPPSRRTRGFLHPP